MSQRFLFVLVAMVLVVCAAGVSAQPEPARNCGATARCLQASGDAGQPAFASDSTDDDSMPRERMHMGHGPGGPGGPDGPGRRNFEQFRMEKLLQLLELRDDQQASFKEAFHEMRHGMRQIDRTRDDLLDSLSEELKSAKPNDRILNGYIDRLLSLEDQRRANMQGFVKKMRGMLSPAQAARLVVFQERFDAVAINMARRFMRRMPPGGMPPDSGEGQRP
jgi:Spy/CpxP family protein refolding chaperone